MDYLSINCLVIPHESIDFAYYHMRELGRKEMECVALFVGKSQDSTFRVTQAIVPKQTLRRSAGGLSYTVDGDELYRLNVWLFENGLKLIAQIHSHPQEAYHSETDDEYPIVTKVGGFSIVVPNYAKDEIGIDKWAVYRLHTARRWKEVSDKEKLIKIE